MTKGRMLIGSMVTFMSAVGIGGPLEQGLFTFQSTFIEPYLSYLPNLPSLSLTYLLYPRISSISETHHYSTASFCPHVQGAGGSMNGPLMAIF